MAGVTDRPFRRLARRSAPRWRCPRWFPPAPSCASRARRGCAWTTTARSARSRCRSPAPTRDARRRGALQRRRGRRDHRHQHGLPGEEGLQRARPARRCSRTSRWSARILDAVVAAVDVPVTLKIRTGPAPERATRCASRASPKRPACRRSRSTAARAPACSAGDAEYDTIAEVKSRGAHPGDRQRRHRHAREGEARARAHRRRRRHDRPRGAGPALDVPRDRALPRDRRAACRRRPCARSRACWSSTSTTCTPSTASEHGVRVARKHIGWYGARPARRRGVPLASVEWPRATAADALEQLPRCNDYFARDSPHEPKATSSPTASSARSSATSRTWTARSPPRSTTWC